MIKPISTIQIKKISEIAEKNKEVIAGYLFGSYAKGKSSVSSDIDLGFICFDKGNLDIRTFSLEISKIISTAKADVCVVDLSDNPVLLLEIINGKVIYQKNVGARVNLEVRILKFYEDYLHLKKISKYYLNKSFKEGIYARKS